MKKWKKAFSGVIAAAITFSMASGSVLAETGEQKTLAYACPLYVKYVIIS